MATHVELEKTLWQAADKLRNNMDAAEYIGKDIDDAMDAIEKDNALLKGVLPKDYARPALDKQRLGELIDLIGSISLSSNGKGKDVLGFVFEYFLGQFADAEGKKGGQFYTPQCIVKLLVAMLAPEAEKRVYDKTETAKFRNCTHETLFIDAREYGSMISRKQRELTDNDIAAIAGTYQLWRGKNAETAYKDIPGFCKSAPIQDIRNNKYILTPGRYIDFREAEDDGVAFDEKMKTLTETLAMQMQKANELDIAIKENLQKIGYEL